MVTDLEQRRLAIVDALRAIMAEPLPPRQEPIPVAQPTAVAEPVLTEPVAEEPVLPLPVAEEPVVIDLTEPPAVRETEPVAEDPQTDDLDDRFFLSHEWDEELEDRSEVSVPPLEAAGTMSRIASLALFGHA
jgi:hypothetical protein